LSQVTHANRRIRGSPLTYDTAGGWDFSIDYLRASAPQSRKTSFKKLKNHSPLEGESEKSSRMAKADPVGGSHKASQRRDLVRRRGFAQPKLQAKADAVGPDAKGPARIARSPSPSGVAVEPNG